MDITCGRCRRSYYVPDDLVQGRTFRAKCSQCGHAFAVDVAAARRGKGGRGQPEAPAGPDSLPSTSASAIPGFADALADADLGWLDEAAAKADARDEQVFLLTVQRSRRGSAVAIAAGALVALGAAAGLVVWMKTRGPPEGAAARAARADGPAPLAVRDAGGLAARPPEPEPEAAEAAPQPAPAPGSRLGTRRLSSRDRRLLDLLARKEDAKPVGPQEEDEAVESDRSALDPAAAEKVIAANRRAFDACVSKALRLKPDLKLARRATMLLTVQPDGKVSEATLVEEQIARSDLGVCLSEAARRMVFPGFDGDPLEIAMPLSLSATY